MKLLKMSITFCLIVSLFWFSQKTVHAQDIYYSKVQKINFHNSDYSVVGRSGAFIYTYTASVKGYFLDAYNDSMELKARIALDFFPTDILDAKFINYSNQIIVLYQAEERNHIIQYAALLDSRALLIGQTVALDSVRTSWFGGNKSYFYYAQSMDKNKIILYRAEKNKIRTTLIDKNLNVLYHQIYQLNTTGSFNANQTLLANNGTFYITLSEEIGRKGYETNFRLLQFSKNGERLIQKTLPIEKDIFYSGIYSKINQNNGLVYSAGFYADNKNGNLQGVVSFTFNPATNVFSKIKEIPFNSELKNDAQSRNKNKAFNNAQVRNLIIKNDGGFLIISENKKVTTHTEMSPNIGYYSWYYSPAYTNQTIYEFHFGDILVLNFNNKDQLLWHQFIRKNQYSQNDNGLFSSFAFLNSGATLVFLFNDFSYRKNKIVIAVLNATGQSQIQVLKTGNVDHADWLPRDAKQISKTAWIIPILNQNHLFFAKVAF